MNADEAMKAFIYPNRRADTIGRLEPLTDTQQAVYNLLQVGWDADQIANRMNMHESAVRDKIAKIKHKGYPL